VVNERAREVARLLLDTQRSLQYAVTAAEARDQLFLTALDQLAQSCDGCGVWTEPGLLDHRGCCEDCRED
jgi:hypothetical protein